jgi:hypothetical protein
MSDVFISYSRRDQEFVRRLHDALGQRDKTVWVDWEGIPPTSEWLREIREAIVEADAFAFALSPESANSRVCREELGFAVEQNKRIVPLLRREPDAEMVPANLSSRNWIGFTDDEDFDRAVKTLVDALDTDLERARFHTRLLVRAGEWAERARDKSGLLRGTDLRDAEGFIRDRVLGVLRGAYARA